MNNKIKAIEILETYSKLLLNETQLEHMELQQAINQLKDLEHYAHYTAGLYATDRPELFKAQTQNELMFELNFWDKPKT